ncbi:DUF4249 domain-containing protein [Chondrinema litorale]|uniref:DUF4249 domain-containing protein n=1 Tax=Chondrinema litorale TaxID=2994555 RepID=UPI002543867D|nr:DUF4249 domain-containing protein [Chondrinema litorale]UZR94322.1 DUF4249 domain-containing protein [Chondrinema litorale]
MKKHLPILLLFSIISCETVLDIELPEEPNSLVINGIVPADSTWLFRITSSIHPLDNDYNASFKAIENAEVSITNSSGENTTLTYNEYPPDYIDCNIEDCTRYGYYSAKNEPAPVAGEVYTIKVKASGYPEASSTIQLPLPVQVEALDIRIPSIYGSNSEQNGAFNITDITGEKNYYIFELYNLIEQKRAIYDDDYNVIGYDSVAFYEKGELSSPDASVINSSVSGFDNNDFKPYLLINDELFDGSKHEINFKSRIYTVTTENKFTFVLKHISESYYKYLLSYESYDYSEDNPFAEPAQVFSNVENGLGIIATYAADTMIITK